MSASLPDAEPDTRTSRHRRRLARAALVLSLLLLAATFLLISPPSDRVYPGAIPWRAGSILNKIIGLMSLGGIISTIRGVEIKDFAFYLAGVAGLTLLSLKALLLGARRPQRQELKSPWLAAQLLLLGWVALSALSALWSRDADISLAQAALYGLALVWALVLAWTLESRDVRWLLAGLVAVSAVGATLCIWYYHERNPYHRPGFPIGNPSTLAASTLPALLIALAALLHPVWRRVRGRAALPWAQILGAGAALIPLIWCFRLTSSRAAMVGLAIGLAVILFIQASRRTRWIVLAATVVLALAGSWWLYSTQLEVAMARGATVRFRLYAWRYAAELWQQRPLSGVGAGSYTRLAAWHAVGDRALDPGAFMGQLVEHAHNELFEVLAEIGLLGGLTFVGGYVATFVAGAALLGTAFGRRRKGLVTILIAALAALLADSMFGVGLRLPGVPPVFYTLLGALWALCRCAARARRAGEPVAVAAAATGPRLYTLAAAASCLALALGAGWLTLRNWSGVRYEQAADVNYRRADYAAARPLFDTAEPLLLDPIRKLEANMRSVQCQFEVARAEVERWRELEQRAAGVSPTPTSAATSPSPLPAAVRRRALRLCRETYYAAAALSRRAPTFGRMTAVGAKCAEMLAGLYGGPDSQPGREWRRRAEQAWRLQRRQNPYDVEALLALIDDLAPGLPASLSECIALLRDALRAGFTPEQADAWSQKLRRLARVPGFQATLEAFVRAAGPFNPQTDLNSLIASMAPEAFRLSAAWKKLRGDFAGAERDAARAADLYAPMRPRFPTLYSVALAYQAEYAFRATAGDPTRPIALLRRAIEGLPRIQEQKYEELVRPFRLGLARYLLAAGQVAEATRLLRRTLADDEAVRSTIAGMYVGLARTFLRLPAAERPPVRAWVQAALRHRPEHWFAWGLRAWLEAETGDIEAVKAALRDAAAAGVTPEQLRRIRTSLAQEYPRFSETLRGRQKPPHNSPP